MLPAEISTVVCDNQSKAEILLQNREKGQTAVLKTIVLMDPFKPELVERGAKCGVDIVSMQDVEVMSKEWLLVSNYLFILALMEMLFMFCRLLVKVIFKSQL